MTFMYAKYRLYISLKSDHAAKTAFAGFKTTLASKEAAFQWVLAQRQSHLIEVGGGEESKKRAQRHEAASGKVLLNHSAVQ